MHIEFFGIRFRPYPYPYPYPYPPGGLGVAAITPPRFVLRIRQMVSWSYQPRKGTPMFTLYFASTAVSVPSVDEGIAYARKAGLRAFEIVSEPDGVQEYVEWPQPQWV